MGHWSDKNLSAVQDYPMDFEQYIEKCLRGNDDIDALVSFTYQYGKGWWTKEGKVMPEFVRKGDFTLENVRETFAKHDYKERRAVEAEVFINGYQ